MFYTIGIIFIFLVLFVYFFLRIKITYRLSQPWIVEKFVCNLPEIRKFETNHHYFSSKPLIGKVGRDEEGFELVQNLLKIIHEKVRSPKKRILCVAEVLTKVLAYRDLKEKTIVKIPINDKRGKNFLATYEVDKVFDMWKEMPAFGLIPIDNQKIALPILLFRGTDFSLTTRRSIASLLSDLDISGPGVHTFREARGEIHSWLKKAFITVNQKTRVLGFSLGGSFTSYTLILEYRLVAHEIFQPSISFNSPGVIKRLYLLWNKIAKDKKPLYFVFSTQNDLVPKYGYQIGKRYEIATSKMILPIHAHVTLISAQKDYVIYPSS